jgi:hypothetical protein
LDWARPGLLAWDPLCITNNRHAIVINTHQDFVASKHGNFFQGVMDWNLIY